VDPAVGIEIAKKPGEAVKAGDIVAQLFLHSPNADFAERVSRAFSYGDNAPEALPLVVDRITAQ
jgi:thymidine phosphorylase